MADHHPPKGSKKNHSGSGRSNPYSSRGLDKFSSVLTELRAKKEEITARTSSQAIAMVRFTYSTSKDWIPLVVQRKDDNDQGSKAKELRPPPQAKEAAGKAQAKKAERRRKLSYHMLVVILLILLCIVMSGRMFAICCTSVWWYLVPKLKSGETGNTKIFLVRRMIGGW